MSDYKPIPVSEAAAISKRYEKEIVVITAYDAILEITHTTTFGVTPAGKDAAARWGELCAAAIGASVMESTWYEDYRATTEAQYKAIVDELLAALKGVLALIEEGRLVRDTSDDPEPDWAMRQIPFVQALARADSAIMKAEGMFEARPPEAPTDAPIDLISVGLPKKDEV